MIPIKYVTIPYEHFGLVYRDGRFVKLLKPGRTWYFDPLWRVTIGKLWQGKPWIEMPATQLRQLRESPAIQEHAVFVDLKDTQRALVWLDGRFHGILEPGLYAYWKTIVDVRVEVMDVRNILFRHDEADVILKTSVAKRFLDVYETPENLGSVVYVDGRFHTVFGPGTIGYWKNGLTVRRETFALPWLPMQDSELEKLREGGQLDAVASFVDVQDTQRALVWFSGRFHCILGPGLYAYLKEGSEARVNLVDATMPQFIYDELDVIFKHAEALRQLAVYDIADTEQGVLYQDGKFSELLSPGRYAFWKDVGNVRVRQYDLREQVLDVSGQEIMTADKVTLRLNAVLTYRIVDVRKAAETVKDAEQALYRELQLIIRAEVGGRTLDELLSDKTAVAHDALKSIQEKAAGYGLEVKGLGIRDVILPGDMKELLNQVIEAEKAAQANVIKRREETAAMRSQLNTAKMIEDNPMLLRLRELETVEKIAEKTNLQIFVGDGQGLTKSIVKLV
ncbi:slipin family protein [Cerasicoccus fimbriatus]|uniref:slipin family protein n=1 Tax=Cerasicoccus fimbriatus TaxID=3014554 RepID=UPI0022B4187A|nr:slipin family protein [Cerasicoccus sp. TK19100]